MNSSKALLYVFLFYRINILAELALNQGALICACEL